MDVIIMKKKIKLILLIIFLISELILGILVQTTKGNLNSFVMYMVVVLAFIFPLLFFNKNNDFILTSIGLLFTLGADFFLVILVPYIELPAMISFSITQICYFIRIYLNHKTIQEKRIHIIIRITLISLIIIFAVILMDGQIDLLTLISAFYYANLISNIIFAFKQTKVSILFPIGLLLFALCDLQVGISYVNDYYISFANIPILNFIANPPINLAWVFYTPSQVLISLSIIKFKKEFSN
jgi:hypothetical protein